MKREHRLAVLPCLVFACASLPGGAAEAGSTRAKQPLNVLIVTVDDMNCDSVSVFGSPVRDATPRIDRLAAEGMRFKRAHVNVSVCQPSRACLLTGLYSHRSGVDGFNQVNGPLPTLMSELRASGYRVGIIGKVDHSTPQAGFVWDYARVGPQPDFTRERNRELFLEGRNPAMMAERATEFFRECESAGKPFLLVANITDPHRPFAGSEQERTRWDDAAVTAPSRIYRAEEMTVPAWLPDLPEIGRELAEYYSSVRRADDAVGRLLDALAARGLAETTLVIFLSDNGVSLPFAKSNCYLASTATPLIVRWPGVTAAGTADDRHLVSLIDLCPTALEAAGAPVPSGLDGRSLVPLLRGESQDGREAIFAQYHENSARQRYPMRSIQTARYLYIYNPWADGRREMKMESLSGLSWKAMQAAAQTDAGVAARVKFFQYRVREEFYDLSRDPDALINLATDSSYGSAIHGLRLRLEQWMQATNDSALEAFRHRDDEAVRARFMEQENAVAAARPRLVPEM